MHIHLPKPLHGWREFLGEVVIIVIGVLVALTAEQLVEAAHRREEVGKFREAVNHELGRNIGVYERMIAVGPCVDRTLADLERFLRDAEVGRTDKLLRRIGRRPSQSQYFSVWDEKGAGVSQHLGVDERIKYSELYDEFRSNETQRASEREVWRSLSQFDSTEPLDHADRRRLRELLTRAEQLNAVIPLNYEIILNLARPLGIHGIDDPVAKRLMYQDEFCRPLLAPA